MFSCKMSNLSAHRAMRSKAVLVSVVILDSVGIKSMDDDCDVGGGTFGP